MKSPIIAHPRETISCIIMAKIGHISEFNVTNDDWDIYVERVKLFLKANSVKNDMKVATFLTIMGNEAYKKLRTLCAPEQSFRGKS